MRSDSDLLNGRLVGRGDEVALLGQLVTDAAGGTGGTLLVQGEDGVGKTALLRAGLAGAAAAGCAVAWATGDELARSVPFGLVAQWRNELPGNLGVTADEPVTEWSKRQCAARPLILVAENLQWADDASVSALRGLGELAPRLPLLVLASRRMAAETVGLSWVVQGWPVLQLEPLAPSEVAQLLERIAGGPPGARLAELARLAGGNPLYLRELIGALTRDNRVRVLDGQAELVGEPGQDGVIAVPPALAARARAKVAELGEKGAAALRWATLLDPEFTVADLATVTGWDDGELRDVVSAAAAARVLTVDGTRAAFAHGVTRRALYEGMPASMRSALHLRAARAMADAGGTPAQVAAQLAVVPEIKQEWAVDWLARTVPALLSEAPGLTAGLLGRVLAGLPDADSRREELQAAQVTAAFRLDRYEEADRIGTHVLASTRDAGRVIEVSWIVAHARLRTGRPGDAAETVTAALRWPGVRDSWAARLQAVRALALAELGPEGPAADVTSAQELAAAALAAAERAGDKLATALALQALSQACLLRSDYAARLETLDQALAVVGGDPEATGLRLQLLIRRSEALRRLGRRAEALAAAEHAMRNAEQAGSLTWLAHGELAAVYFT
ncbi:MAG: AAA family ATPase, partial [Trebonia sp.]